MRTYLHAFLFLISIASIVPANAEFVCAKFFGVKPVANSSQELLSFFNHYFAREIVIPELTYNYRDTKRPSLKALLLQGKETANDPYRSVEDSFFAERPELRAVRAKYSLDLSKQADRIYNPVSQEISRTFAYELSRYHLEKIRPQDRDHFEMDFHELLNSFWNYYKEEFLAVERVVVFDENNVKFKPWARNNAARYFDVFKRKLEDTFPYVVDVYNKEGFRAAKPYRYDDAEKISTTDERLYNIRQKSLKAQRLYTELKKRYDHEYSQHMEGFFKNVESTLLEAVNKEGHKDTEAANTSSLSYAIIFQNYKVAFAALDVYLSELDLRTAYVLKNKHQIDERQPRVTEEEIDKLSVQHQAHRAQFIADLMFLKDFIERKDAADAARGH